MLKNKEEIRGWLNRYLVENYTINDDFTVDVAGCVEINNCNLKEIPVQFNKVSGSFNCSHNQLSNLYGSPIEVGASFWCYENQLTTLEGGPKVVGFNFDCADNQLTNLRGCPEEVKKDFNCDNNLNGLGLMDEVEIKHYMANQKLANTLDMVVPKTQEQSQNQKRKMKL